MLIEFGLNISNR